MERIQIPGVGFADRYSSPRMDGASEHVVYQNFQPESHNANAVKWLAVVVPLFVTSSIVLVSVVGFRG